MGQAGSPLPSLVVVPRRVGPLIVPLSSGPDSRDELDLELDQVFGPPIAPQPGPLDAALVVGGIAAITFAELTSGTGLLLLAGVLSTMLGLALPARHLWQRLSRARAAERMASILKQGDPLNLTDPHTRRLAVAFAGIQARSVDSDDPAAAAAAEASLQALQEVAVLLRGRSPLGVAETEYVTRRTEAVEGLERSLVSGRGDPKTARDATVEAISRFEERSGLSSLDRIASLRVANRALRR